MTRSSIKLISMAAVAVSVTACANTGAAYRPILDGPQSHAYQSDLAECQMLAQQREYLNEDTRSDAMVGALIGGVLGAIDGGDIGDALGGAAVGGIAGGATGAYDVRDERKSIVIQCLKGRGHPVVG